MQCFAQKFVIYISINHASKCDCAYMCVRIYTHICFDNRDGTAPRFSFNEKKIIISSKSGHKPRYESNLPLFIH